MADPKDPSAWRKLTSAWIDRLREEGAKTPSARPGPKKPIMIDYRVFDDGTAFHTQDMGWHMTADVLFEQIVARQTPRKGRTEDESQLHAEFDSLATRQIAYVYLASWRLSIEIGLKQALISMHAATHVSVPNRLPRLLQGHDIANLWLRLLGVVPQMEAALHGTAIDCGIDPAGPGFSLDPAGYQATIDLLVSIDPDGQSLRYRQNLSGDNNMSTFASVDIADAQVRFTNLHLYLQRCSSRATSVQQIRECRQITQQTEADAREGT